MLVYISMLLVIKVSEFIVWLGMAVDATNARDAAEQVQFNIQEPGTNWLYEVTNSDTGEMIKVDLEFDDRGEDLND